MRRAVARGRAGVIVISVALLLAGCGGGQSPSSAAPAGGSGGAASSAAAAPATGLDAYPLASDPEVKVRAVWCAVAGAMFPLWVAKEAGIFARHKLDVEVQLINGGDVNLAALMRGEVDFIECAGGSLIPGIMAGADAAMIANLYRGNPYRLVVVPEVQRMSDLKGRRLAINKAGEFDNRLIELMLDRYGLVGNQDVTLVPLGGQTDRYTGLKGGLVDGTIVNPPVNLTAQNEGFHEIFNFNELGISAVYISLFTSRQNIQTRPRLVERFLAAMIEAEAYAKAEREFTIRLMGDYLKLGDRAALEGAYQAFAVDSLAIPPSVPTDAVQAVMDETLRINPNAPVRDAAAVIDTRPLQAVEATGFVNAIQANLPTNPN
jgi:NitT/TauT family transport system substrate-binding protein